MGTSGPLTEPANIHGSINNTNWDFPDSSAGKESVCNAGDPGLIPRSGRSVFLGFSCGLAGKESTCNPGDLGSVPGLGRFPGEEKGYPLQYSGLENSGEYSPWGHKELDTTEQLSLWY